MTDPDREVEATIISALGISAEQWPATRRALYPGKTLEEIWWSLWRGKVAIRDYLDQHKEELPSEPGA